MKEFVNKYGFIKYTELKLDGDTISTIEEADKKNVVYAIAIDDQLVYIGKSKSLRKRINYYRTSMYRQTKTSDSNKSQKIFEALQSGSTVVFYARQCFNLSMTNELGTMSISTMDLEEPMFIKMFNPPWNTQHKPKRGNNAEVILKPNEFM